MPGVRSGEAVRAAVNREIEPPLELGLPYWFHLFFPGRLLTTDLSILVIGCEDELALKLARANPRARITALEEHPAWLENTARARDQRNLNNLDLASTWPSTPGPDEGFDLIYYNTPSWPGEPSALLERAGGLLRREGSLHLTLRARYAWTGVRTVRELLERLGIQPDADGYPRARQVVAALAPDHPWNLLAPDPNIRPDDLLADWLRPEEPCFSVPEVYALLAGSGLALQRFTYQAYYLPQCSALARTPLLAEVRQLPPEQQQALMELYWPEVRYHLVVACREDRPAHTFATDFSGKEWSHYAPLLPARLPLEEDESPVGAKARVCWRAAGMPDVAISLGGFQYRLLRALDRAEELGDVVGLAGLSGDPQLRDEWARDFFRLMADFDFLHFRTCRASDMSATGFQIRAADPAHEPQPAWDDVDTFATTTPEPLPLSGLPSGKAPPAGKARPPLEAQQAAGEPETGLSGLRPPPPGVQSSQRAEDPLVAGISVSEPPQAGPEPPPPTAEHAEEAAEEAEEAEEVAARLERIPYEACPLCGEPGYQSFRQAEAEIVLETRFVRVPMPWVRCRRCAHVFTAGYFAGEIWRRILEASLRDCGSLRPALDNRSQASRIVSTITTLRERAAGRWLDVGCSHSGLIAVAAEFGYDSVGVDYCQQATERLGELGYEVRAGSLFDCQDGPFDVISLSGVLHRMPFPSQALSHARRLLAPRGLLFLSTASSDTLSWRNLDSQGLNPYWSRLDRYHTFHRKSVFRLLESTGFDPCSYGTGAPEPVGMEIVACRR